MKEIETDTKSSGLGYKNALRHTFVFHEEEPKLQHVQTYDLKKKKGTKVVPCLAGQQLPYEDALSLFADFISMIGGFRTSCLYQRN